MDVMAPIKTNDFSFLEFTASNPIALSQLFLQLGFQLGYHDQKTGQSHYSQGNIHLVITPPSEGRAKTFMKVHEQGTLGMAFLVDDAFSAYQRSKELGAITVTDANCPFPAIEGVGGSVLYLVDQALLNKTWSFTQKYPDSKGVGLSKIDHLTHNLKQGQMAVWQAFYERLFGFKPIRDFKIKGKHTGLISYALANPNQNIKIPLNEGTDPQSQIEEFITDFHGEGIQHIAFKTDNIYEAVEKITTQGIDFMTVPDTYYEMLPQRIPHQPEPIERLQADRILIDGDMGHHHPNLLLQIFTQPLIGPVFFEIIQRMGNEGFGEGNFQALFESIELDQIRRGVIR